ncbi:MAG: putative toxin-antitoxin system toxin component, PIN family, partial [Acetobacteraceae bacterium]|nr:putative toxin-antitoxin system toxin component, PIN family [Acetobacteraceae bacterium]
MIVFDVSTLVGAAIKRDGVPARALLKARARDTLALSRAVRAEMLEVLHRPELARFLGRAQRDEVLELVTAAAAWVEPAVAVTDCRDAKDNKYLELALASGAA